MRFHIKQNQKIIYSKWCVTLNKNKTQYLTPCLWCCINGSTAPIALIITHAAADTMRSPTVCVCLYFVLNEKYIMRCDDGDVVVGGDKSIYIHHSRINLFAHTHTHTKQTENARLFLLIFLLKLCFQASDKDMCVQCLYILSKFFFIFHSKCHNKPSNMQPHVVINIYTTHIIMLTLIT